MIIVEIFPYVVDLQILFLVSKVSSSSSSIKNLAIIAYVFSHHY